MKARVLDTSVAIAWYLPEKWSLAARGLREKFLEGKLTLWVPALHFWEVANVLRTYVRRGELTETLAREIYATHLDAPLEIAEPQRGDVLRIALSYNATAYDAVYIALAIQQQAPLLTAERTTTPWVVKLAGLADPL